MKQFLIILTFSLITSNSFAQTACNIIDDYEKIFRIEKKKYGEQEYLIKTINVIDSSSCFSDLINNNEQYISYLLTNFSDNSNYENLMAINDSIILQNKFIKSLKKDSLFNNEMNRLTKKISDELNYSPETISMNELLDIAVKYFSILKIDNKGNYVGKVCAGINGLKETEEERKPQIEAFCFSTILKNYQGEQFNMYNEFVSSINELYKINLGINKEERLLRAQGAMYILMKNNVKLKELLITEYKYKKDYLPFVLKGY